LGSTSRTLSGLQGCGRSGSDGYCLFLGRTIWSGLNARTIRNYFGRPSPFGLSHDALLILSVHQIPLCQAIIVVAKEGVRCVFGQLKKFDRIASIALRCAQRIGHNTLPFTSVREIPPLPFTKRKPLSAPVPAMALATCLLVRKRQAAWAEAQKSSGERPARPLAVW
jgi:small nuclear ribonucleoprotein (snRNP)-like protein